MNREETIKAIDDAYEAGIRRCYDIVVEGLQLGTSIQTLAERFRRGLAFHSDAHAKTTAMIEDYFKGFK